MVNENGLVSTFMEFMNYQKSTSLLPKLVIILDDVILDYNKLLSVDLLYYLFMFCILMWYSDTNFNGD